MGERRLHSEPVSVTVGKVTAETRYSGAIVWVGTTGWSDSFPIANLQSRAAMHTRQATATTRKISERRNSMHIAKALVALIDAIAEAKQAAKEKAHG